MEAGATIRLLCSDQEVLSAAVTSSFRFPVRPRRREIGLRFRDHRESFSGSSMIPPRSPGLSIGSLPSARGAGRQGREVRPAQHSDQRIPLRENQSERFRRLLLVRGRRERSCPEPAHAEPDRQESPCLGSCRGTRERSEVVMKKSIAWPSIVAMALLLSWVEPAPCGAQPPAPAAADGAPGT